MTCNLDFTSYQDVVTGTNGFRFVNSTQENWYRDASLLDSHVMSLLRNYGSSNNYLRKRLKEQLAAIQQYDDTEQDIENLMKARRQDPTKSVSSMLSSLGSTSNIN